MQRARPKLDRTFAILFTVMLAIAAGNTALQSVLPALGRSLGVADSAVALAFSVSALLWVIAAPLWANRSERSGRRAMVLTGMWGFVASLALCGVFLAAGINGWISGTAAFLAFVAGRVIYGTFGAAAPPAVQAIVAGRTTREERTRALSLLASAFGLGTIIGPAIAPYLVVHRPVFGVEIGLSGPAFFAAGIGLVVIVLVHRLLPRDEPLYERGAAQAYPSIGGQATGASITAATGLRSEHVGFLDPRIRAWMIIGTVIGHAQVMAGQTIGFLVIDRLGVAPEDALEPTGIVLMMGAGAALLAQWGIIPMFNMAPAVLVRLGLVIALAGCAVLASAVGLYGMALGYALASLGFGFIRPGFTAGSSLAVGQAAQGSVAGKVTSVNGVSFVLGPSIGVGLYALWRPLPYWVAAAALGATLVYALVNRRLSARDPAPSPER